MLRDRNHVTIWPFSHAKFENRPYRYEITGAKTFVIRIFRALREKNLITEGDGAWFPATNSR